MSLVLTESNEPKRFWIEQEFLSEAVRNTLIASDAIIAPLLNFREGVPVSFHQGTLSFFDYLQNSLIEAGLNASICAPDNEYYEIALHAKAHRLANVVVTYAIAPLVISLMANYIYDELKAKPDDTISTSITLEHQDCKTYQIEYDGKAHDFPIVIEKVKELSEECKEKENGKQDEEIEEDGSKMNGNRGEPDVHLV
ncbi:MAG: hypothetical protein ABW168_03025 [Sedimenticola sp.]